MCVRMYVFIHVCVCMYMHICVYLSLFLSLSLSLYIYIYIYIYMFTFMLRNFVFSRIEVTFCSGRISFRNERCWGWTPPMPSASTRWETGRAYNSHMGVYL